jgi:hypothetical protein
MELMRENISASYAAIATPGVSSLRRNFDKTTMVVQFQEVQLAEVTVKHAGAG